MVLMNVRIDLPSGAKSYLHWWYAASEQGNPEAQAFVGDQSTEPAIAFHWHLRAAENGHAPSLRKWPTAISKATVSMQTTTKPGTGISGLRREDR